MGRRRTAVTAAISVAAVAVATLVAVIAVTGDGDRVATGPAGTGPGRPAAVPSSTVITTGAEAVVLAAGDIASCGSAGDEATAALLDVQPADVVVTLGDNAYFRGTPAEFAGCYDPTWGRSRSRTRPAPGNHDYGTARATGYFGYFGEAAGDPAEGYYSYEAGPWHVVALNSNCTVVACGPGSAQERWLRHDLASHPRRCVLAYWHHPRFSSGTTHGSSTAVAALWQALYDGGADLVLSGHEHHYERLGPLDPSGRPDPVRGLRSFVVGTGGMSHYGFGTPVPGSEVRDARTFGVLRLALAEGSFRWRFLPVEGESFTDTGSASCR